MPKVYRGRITSPPLRWHEDDEPWFRSDLTPAQRFIAAGGTIERVLLEEDEKDAA